MTNVEVLDLNIFFHELQFPAYKQYYQNKNNWIDYEVKTARYNKETTSFYAENNKKIINGEKPAYFTQLLKKIMEKKPDVVAFSIVYSSQAFYAFALLKELGAYGINTVIGGPSINNKLIALAGKTFSNSVAFLNFIEEKEIPYEVLQTEIVPDFSVYDLDAYFTPQPVIPIRTSTTCYYKQCAFCSHYNKVQYSEYSLDLIKKIIVDSKQRYFYFIDDMIPVKRLLQIAEIVKPLNIQWACQLKPTADFNYATLRTLHEAGLTFVMWGVESGCQRILDCIKKGTIKKDVANVLQESHRAGIKNVTFIMFGFPTETKEDFLETISFLEDNRNAIDLVHDGVFGLQKGTPIYNNPEVFGVTSITEQERTVLEPRISYTVSSGLTNEEASTLRRKYKKTLENIGKYPKSINFFKEHMLCLLDK